MFTVAATVAANQEFAVAAQAVDALLTIALPSPDEGHSDPAAIAEWMRQVKSLLDRTEPLLARTRMPAGSRRLAPEVELYRGKLELLRQTVQVLQQRLLSERAAMQSEWQHHGRVRAWADTVSKLT